MSGEVAGDFSTHLGNEKFGTILADPPWRFANRTGKIAPEHHRLSRYGTLSFDEIAALPVADYAADVTHCHLWVPNALLPYGLNTLESWGFEYKTNLIWHKIRKDDGPDGRGVGFYFRNVTEIILFGVRGKSARTLDPGRSQVNFIAIRKREQSRKPDEQYDLIEACSWGHISNCLGAERARAGRSGAIRRKTTIAQTGQPTAITLRWLQSESVRPAGAGFRRGDHQSRQRHSVAGLPRWARRVLRDHAELQHPMCRDAPGRWERMSAHKRLGGMLEARGWSKRNVEVTKAVDGVSK